MLENLDELYSKIEELEEEIIEVPELQLYLQSLYSLLTEFKDKEASLDTFYEIIQKSFFTQPTPFKDVWLEIKEAPNQEDYDDFGYLRQVILFQISELKKMENKQLKDKLNYLGVISETGNHWYNFYPFMNLECGIRAFIDNKPLRNAYFINQQKNTEFETELDDDSKNITWKSLGNILELGRMYE
ncbi:MAG: hypothetical protein U0457_16375 [Candidatus Sericytochromatia bacterium]